MSVPTSNVQTVISQVTQELLSRSNSDCFPEIALPEARDINHGLQQEFAALVIERLKKYGRALKVEALNIQELYVRDQAGWPIGLNPKLAARYAICEVLLPPTSHAFRCMSSLCHTVLVVRESCTGTELFYDAETPQGVQSLFEIPSVLRVLNEGPSNPWAPLRTGATNMGSPRRALSS